MGPLKIISPDPKWLPKTFHFPSIGPQSNLHLATSLSYKDHGKKSFDMYKSLNISQHKPPRDFIKGKIFPYRLPPSILKSNNHFGPRKMGQ